MITPTLLLAAALAQPGADAAPLDWKTEEAALLSDHVQLTFPDRFVKAGEAYFDHNSPPQWVIFQAVPVPEEGEEPSPFYSMYIAKLQRDGDGAFTGIEEPIRISSEGTANTCGFFSPVWPGSVMYATTLHPPAEAEQPGYQRGTGRYTWEFPREMRIVTQSPPGLYFDVYPEQKGKAFCGNTFMIHPVVGRGEGYCAEGAYSPDGRCVVYAKMVDPETRNLDIHVYDFQNQRDLALVARPGYDGGPFFAPSGDRICYRSEPGGDSLLQLRVADLKMDRDGRGPFPIGVLHEHRLTDDEHVNWAPFWHPSGEYLVFTTSREGHRNYEVFAIEVPPAGQTVSASELRSSRITVADGFDGLPVFSADGQWMMWTSQRGEKLESEQRPSSQVWIARVKEGMFESADALFAAEGAGEAGGAGEVLAE